MFQFITTQMVVTRKSVTNTNIGKIQKFIKQQQFTFWTKHTPLFAMADRISNVTRLYIILRVIYQVLSECCVS